METRGYLSPWYRVCTKAILNIKRKLRECRNQKCKPCFGAKSPFRSTGVQTVCFHAAPYSADSANLRKLGGTFRHGTGFAPLQSLYQKEATLMHAEPKNAIPALVQKVHFAVRACKVTVFMQRRIGPTVQMCGNSGLPLPMVPCLHQSNPTLH